MSDRDTLIKDMESDGLFDDHADIECIKERFRRYGYLQNTFDNESCLYFLLSYVANRARRGIYDRPAGPHDTAANYTDPLSFIV